MDSSKALILHLHDFYKELTDEDRARVASGLYNFDHPGKDTFVTLSRGIPFVVAFFFFVHLDLLFLSPSYRRI